jgi:hypothetical protein
MLNSSPGDFHGSCRELPFLPRVESQLEIETLYKRRENTPQILPKILTTTKIALHPQSPNMTVTVPQIQPTDLDYIPIRQKWLDRTERRLKTEKLSTELPEGFPLKLDSGLVWDGQKLPEIYDWTYHLTYDDLEEIKQAVAYFHGECPTSTGF